MHADDLPRATALSAELKKWQQAFQRSDRSVFQSAHLRVVDMAHGHQGQSGETIVDLDSDAVKMIADHHIQRIIGDLHELGIEV